MTRRLIRPVFDPVVIPTENIIIQYESYDNYLKSPRWEYLRQETLERDGRKCRLCNSSEYLNVHHRKYPKNWGEETVDDLTTLCQRCHEKFSLWKTESKKRIKSVTPRKTGTPRSPGGYNGRVVSLLFKKKLIATKNHYNITKTSVKVCEILEISVPETKEGKIGVIKDFYEQTRKAEAKIAYQLKKKKDLVPVSKAIDDLFGLG
jgi:hypothetical protein